MSSRSPSTACSSTDFINDEDYKICDFPTALLAYCQSLLGPSNSEWEFVENLPQDQDSKNSVSTSDSVLQEIVSHANNYVDFLADKIACEYEHNQTSNTNILAKITIPNEKAENAKTLFGTAFVPHYRESTIVRRLYTIGEQHGLPRHLQNYETRSYYFTKNDSDSLWAKVATTLSYNQLLITFIKTLSTLQCEGMDFSETLNAIQKHVLLLQAAFENLSSDLNRSESEETVEPQRNPSHFYPIDEERLKELTGKQLITICLEEHDAHSPTELLQAIFQKHHWVKVERTWAENETELKGRTDDPTAKMDALRNQRQEYLTTTTPPSSLPRSSLFAKPSSTEHKQSSPPSVTSTLAPYLQTAANSSMAALPAGTILLVLLGIITPALGVLIGGGLLLIIATYVNVPPATDNISVSTKP